MSQVKSFTQVLEIFSSFLLIIGLLGCNSVEKRISDATTIAASHGFKESSYQTSSFTLYGQEKITQPDTGIVHVYIEGDGFSWASSGEPSRDPTPTNAIGLRLAAQDPYPNVVYIARPCQFNKEVNKALCHQTVWTDERMSQQALTSFSEALDSLCRAHSFKKIVVFGYSGGGGIAALLAVRRKDIIQVITIAGVLDHVRWTNHYHLRPLKGSLNPIDYAEQLKDIPQIHFVGDEDEVVPLFLTEGYIRALGSSSKARLIVIKNQNHYSGWEKQRIILDSVELK